QTDIVMTPHPADAPLAHENELFSAARVGMLAVEPLRAVNDLSENERRFDRVEDTGAHKIVKGSSAQPAAIEIRQILPRSSLRDDARHQIAHPAGHRHYLDIRILPAERRHDVRMGDLLI